MPCCEDCSGICVHVRHACRHKSAQPRPAKMHASSRLACAGSRYHLASLLKSQLQAVLLRKPVADAHCMLALYDRAASRHSLAQSSPHFGGMQASKSMSAIYQVQLRKRSKQTGI